MDDKINSVNNDINHINLLLNKTINYYQNNAFDIKTINLLIEQLKIKTNILENIIIENSYVYMVKNGKLEYNEVKLNIDNSKEEKIKLLVNVDNNTNNNLLINTNNTNLLTNTNNINLLTNTNNNLITTNNTNLLTNTNNTNLLTNITKSKDYNIKILTKNNKETIKEDVNYKLIPEININYLIKQNNTVENIPCMFQYIKNDKFREGIYCCLMPGIYIKVPFPEIIDSTKEYNRDKTIRCRFKKLSICNQQRLKMSKLHNSIIRICNYAHENDNIIKIGYNSRCTVSPNIGNPNTFKNDINLLDIDDVKHLLLYGLNDIFIAAYWLQNNKFNGVFDSLEKV